MPFVVLSALLPVEDVPQMTTTIVADDLVLAMARLNTDMATALLGVHDPVEARPTTARFELGVRSVKRMPAPGTLEMAAVWVHSVVLR